MDHSSAVVDVTPTLDRHCVEARCGDCSLVDSQYAAVAVQTAHYQVDSPLHSYLDSFPFVAIAPVPAVAADDDRLLQCALSTPPLVQVRDSPNLSRLKGLQNISMPRFPLECLHRRADSAMMAGAPLVALWERMVVESDDPSDDAWFVIAGADRGFSPVHASLAALGVVLLSPDRH